MTPPTVVGVALFGVLTGLLSAVFGVGGGTVMVPFMTAALDMSQHASEGTSLLVIVPTAVAGVLAHRRLQRISIRTVLLLAAGGIVGSYLGASVALEIDANALEKWFGVLIIVVGLGLMWAGITSVRRRRRALRLEG
jgi:uncharacterized protein